MRHFRRAGGYPYDNLPLTLQFALKWSKFQDPTRKPAMRLYFILLLVAVTLVSSVDAGSKFLAGDQVDSVAKRFLKAETDVDMGDSFDSGEERGFTFAEKIKLPKSRTQKVKDIMTDFRAETKFFSFYVTGGLSSPEMKKWADSVFKLHNYDLVKTTNAMLTTMTRYYDRTTVARWAQATKSSIQMGDFADNVQYMQFTKWMDEGKDALGLRKMLKTTATSSDTKGDAVIVQEFAAFVKQRKIDLETWIG